MMKKQITLVNGEKMNRQHPDTFKVPLKALKQTLRPGDSVKVGIEMAHSMSGFGSERVWVRITEAGYPRFSGIIDSVGLFTEDHGLVYGGELSFEARHILDIERRDEQKAENNNQ